MILITGASGSIGSRLVDRLVTGRRELRIAGRRPDTLNARWPNIDAVELDVQHPDTVGQAVKAVDSAYYLVHSMEQGAERGFRERDAEGARCFAKAARQAGVKRIIYLGALGSDRDTRSEHLSSRHEIGRILAAEGPPLIEFRAAMVVSADSASYRMLSDLVNRLPAMVLPRWVSTPSQPIALRDVLAYLIAAIDVSVVDQHTIVEIGGPDVVTYREMIQIVAQERGRRPRLVMVPLLTPKISSYWCAITTSVPMATARPLVAGMMVPTVVQSGTARRMFPAINPMSFTDALAEARTEAESPYAHA